MAIYMQTTSRYNPNQPRDDLGRWTSSDGKGGYHDPAYPYKMPHGFNTMETGKNGLLLVAANGEDPMAKNVLELSGSKFALLGDQRLYIPKNVRESIESAQKQLPKEGNFVQPHEANILPPNEFAKLSQKAETGEKLFKQAEEMLRPFVGEIKSAQAEVDKLNKTTNKTQEVYDRIDTLNKRIDELLAPVRELYEQNFVGKGGECVDLIKKAIGREEVQTKDWKEGPKIDPMSSDNIPYPGTMIGTFKDGVYKGHSMIFYGYGEKNGKIGVWATDQFREGSEILGIPKTPGFPRLRHYPFDESQKFIGNAKNYSIIKKLPPIDKKP